MQWVLIGIAIAAAAAYLGRLAWRARLALIGRGADGCGCGCGPGEKTGGSGKAKRATLTMNGQRVE